VELASGISVTFSCDFASAFCSCNCLAAFCSSSFTGFFFSLGGIDGLEDEYRRWWSGFDAVQRDARQSEPAGVAGTEVVERTTLANEGANMAKCGGGMVLPMSLDAAQVRNQDLLHVVRAEVRPTTSVTCHEDISGVPSERLIRDSDVCSLLDQHLQTRDSKLHVFEFFDYVDLIMCIN
jgi:hypothetical protein